MATSDLPDFASIWALAERDFRLGSYSLHGPDHWRRVERNAIAIAPETGADVVLIRLFAVLHDSRRENESHDPEHGRRAADRAASMRGSAFVLDDTRMATLTEALVSHDKGNTSADPTIGTCWDADRLDLTRVGVVPDPRFMSTASGRRLARLAPGQPRR